MQVNKIYSLSRECKGRDKLQHGKNVSMQVTEGHSLAKKDIGGTKSENRKNVSKQEIHTF